MKFKNFSIWRGRLPHWRADEVTYFVTFRHRRELVDVEIRELFTALLRPDGTRWDLLALCVAPIETELLFRVGERTAGSSREISKIVEPAKNKVGRRIMKRTGERFPPFYTESYDRIVRDRAELEERWQTIAQRDEEPQLVWMRDVDSWDLPDDELESRIT